MVILISVPNNDSHIIDRESLIIEIIKKISLKVPIKINLNNEGPCARSLGLYDLLDRLCDEFEYDPHLISIETCNLIEQHDRYQIKIKPQTIYLDAARQFSRQINDRKKTFGHRFYHFGHFIGHGNLYRLHLASYLNDCHPGVTCQTYHYQRDAEYHAPFVGLEEMMFAEYTLDEIERAYEFLKSCPKKIDQIDQYPILNPTTLNITKIYPDFFLEVVSLTYFSGNTFYIDEKIWRPMLMKTPFMVQGPRDFLKNLRSLGFRTFDKWWDEGYSEDPGRSQNDGIIDNLNRLSKLSMPELKDLYQDMQTVLDHNYDLMMSISVKDFIHA